MRKIIPILMLALITLSCNNSNNNLEQEQLNALQIKVDSLTSALKSAEAKRQITPFMTFQKEDAEQAMNFYLALFDDSEIIELTRWGAEGPGKEGTIMHAIFTLNGKQFMCSDSPPVHEWDFTPAISNFVECKDENELKQLFTKLSENGKVMMPLNNYGFSQQFGWVEDQFGISWQLNLQ